MSKIYYPSAILKLTVILYDYGNSRYSKPFNFTIKPFSVNINKNSYNKADTFSVMIRFEDLPFDPRLIRSLLIAIAVKDLKDLQAFTGATFEQEDVVFIGYADTYNVVFDSSERMIRIEGRDFTSLLIDATFDNANLPDPASGGSRLRKINLNRSIVAIIKDILSNVPAATGLKVRDETEGKALKNFALSVPSYDLVNGRKTSIGGFSYVNPNRTYWDVIVSICEASGIIAYIDLDELVLSSPRLLFTGNKNSKPTLQFFYGNNLLSLEFYRNLGKKKFFNIVVKTFSIRTQAPLLVVIPRDATQAWASRVGVERKLQKVAELDTTGIKRERDAPVYSFTYHGKTKEQLVEIGEKIFEEFIRQQLEGSCQTAEMVVANDRGVEFDVTKIKTGTPIRIEILSEDIQSIMRFDTQGDAVTEGQRQDWLSKRVGYLERRGYPKSIASDLVKAVSSGTGKLRPTFYTREAQIDMSQSGFAMRIGFVNYISLGELTSL